MNNITTGLIIIILAGIFQGSFAVPMSYTRGWKWENSWMIFSVFGMIVFNLVFAFITVRSLTEVYGTLPLSVSVMPVIWGLVWGIGAIGFGLGITSAGLSLGYAVLLGTVLSMGTFIPMIVLHPDDIFTLKGLIVLFGLAITLSGICLSAYAGIRKEREQDGTKGKITKGAAYSVKTGIVICFVAGLCSSVINIGFVLSRPVIDTALSLGNAEIWAGNAVWAAMFSSGGILNIFYCSSIMRKNRSLKSYRNTRSLFNFFLLLFMSLMWIGSFILYGVGASLMGSWGTIIGWSVYMTLSIGVANIWGFMQGEWDGAALSTRRIMFAGLSIIFLAIIVFSVSGTIS